MRNRDEVLFAFNPVPQKQLSESQKNAMLRFNKNAEEFALDILDLVPDCADRTASLRKLLELKFTCIQAITHSAPPEAALVKPKE